MLPIFYNVQKVTKFFIFGFRMVCFFRGVVTFRELEQELDTGQHLI